MAARGQSKPGHTREHCRALEASWKEQAAWVKRPLASVVRPRIAGLCAYGGASRSAHILSVGHGMRLRITLRRYVLIGTQLASLCASGRLLADRAIEIRQ
jgi:hypothetical protein